MILLPLLVSVGVPLVFLYLVRRLNLYASGYATLLICFAVGLAAFPAAYVINTAVLTWLMAGAGFGMTMAAAVLLIQTGVAPVVEEILKSLGLVYVVRRPDFTYFVDGAICGFAAGTAFAVLENLFYLSDVGLAAGLGLSINRAFSTSLMHGTTSALVGVALGRLRFGHGPARLAAFIVGLAAAMALHLSFNRLATGDLPPGAAVAVVIAIGLAGVAAIGGLIWWGLREERNWLRETLQLDVGVTTGESSMVQRMGELNTLLQPVEDHFGPEKCRQVHAFLRLQAQLGLKRKMAALTPDVGLRGTLQAEMVTLQAQMDRLRRAVGVYCMAYVRSILPAENEPLWDQLVTVLAEEREPTMNVWGALEERTGGEIEGA